MKPKKRRRFGRLGDVEVRPEPEFSAEAIEARHREQISIDQDVGERRVQTRSPGQHDTSSAARNARGTGEV
jgi:hypothetical protein